MLTDIEKEMLLRFEKRIVENGVSNQFLVKICEVVETYLNPLTISEYATKYNLSYNGAKNHLCYLVNYPPTP
jgi:response regulator of citrate/malate metabolism